VPLTNSEWWGCFVLITRLGSNPDRYRARFAGKFGVIPCVGGTRPGSGGKIDGALARGDFTAIRSLRRAPEEPDDTAGSPARGRRSPGPVHGTTRSISTRNAAAPSSWRSAQNPVPPASCFIPQPYAPIHPNHYYTTLLENGWQGGGARTHPQQSLGRQQREDEPGGFPVALRRWLSCAAVPEKAIVRCPTERLQDTCSMCGGYRSHGEARPDPPISSLPKHRVRSPIPRMRAPGRSSPMSAPSSTLSRSPLSRQQPWSFSLVSVSFCLPFPARN
jgi:hypothetical protein